MISDRHTDTEMFRDGTRRWLWQVKCGNRLYKAGVCQSLIVAESEAQRAMTEMNAKLKPAGGSAEPGEGEQQEQDHGGGEQDSSAQK